MAFFNVINNATATITLPHSSGDGILHVSPISVFGSGFPLRVTCTRQSDNAFVIYSVQNSGLDVLRINGVLEGTSDIDLHANDICQAHLTAGTISDIHSAVNNKADDSGVIHKFGNISESISGPKVFTGLVVASGGFSYTGASGRIPFLTAGGLLTDDASLVYINGKIGLGTTIFPPTSKISIANGSYLGFQFANGIGDAFFFRANSSNEGEIVTSSYSTPIKIDASTIQLNSNGSTGRVGINSPIPAAQLHITSNSSATKALIVRAVGIVATISNVAVTTNVATITTSSAHNFVAGNSIIITNLTNSVLNGTYTISSTPTSTTFTFSKTTTDIASVADVGTATQNTLISVQEWQDNTGTTGASVVNVPGRAGIFAIRAGTSSTYVENGVNTSNFPYIKSSTNGISLETNDLSTGYADITLITNIAYGVRIAPNRVNTGATVNGRLYVDVAAANNKGVVIKSVANQSANLTEWQNSSNVAIAKTTKDYEQVATGFASAISSIKTSNYTITNIDSTVLGSGNFPVILLPASSVIPGRVFVMKNIGGSGAITVTASGVDTIDGVGAYILNSQNKYVTIQSDGVSKWYVIGNN
jgi:hypothetical protein